MSEPLPDHVLLVTASPRGRSRTVGLADAFVARYLERRPAATVDRLDAFEELRPFGRGHADAKMTVIAREPMPPDAAREWDDVRTVAARLEAARLVVIAAPMWNSGIPWALKLFIDTVTQPGIAFRFDRGSGYHGLLGGRRAVLALTSQVFRPGLPPTFGVDHHASYLRWWLGLCGIDEVHELRLQPTAPAPDLAERNARAIDEARALADRLAPQEALR